MSRIADAFDRVLTFVFRALVPPNVLEWPLWARRAFLLTLPVSGPLWLCWIAGFFALLVLLVWVGSVIFLLAYPAAIIFALVIAARDFASDLWAPATDFTDPAQGEGQRPPRTGMAPGSQPSKDPT